MVAADHLLTVAMPTVKELAGLPRITDTLEQVRQAYRPKLTLAGVVPCAIPPRSHGRHYVDALDLLRAQWGGKVAPPVRKAVRVPESYAARRPLPLYDPGAGVTHDYRAVLAWLLSAGVYS